MDDDDYKLSGDTMRHLENLAHAPGETRFRLGLVYALRDIRRELTRLESNIVQRIAKAERAIIGPGRVATIIKSEIKDDPRLAKLETETKRLWWAVGILVASLAGIMISRALKNE